MANVEHKHLGYGEIIVRVLVITLGALGVALGLKLLIIPAEIIDGGVVGISLMTSHLTHLPLGIFLFVFNLPFVVLGYKQIGKTFAVSTLYGIVVMSIGTAVFASFTPVTTDPFLASIFGGMAVGVGIGLVIKNGGALDGTEIVAILISKKTGVSIGQVILLINVVIFGVAAFVYGIENALYSMVAYYIAFKAIDLTVEGLQDVKSVMIITDHDEEIADSISHRLGRNVTFLNAEGGYEGAPKRIIYVVITRLEEAKLKSICHEIDEKAFITVTPLADVRGGTFEKKDIH